MEKFNIALIFGEDYNQRIIDYANRLYKSIKSDVILGINARPHLTIAQFEASYKEAVQIWNAFNDISIPPPKLTLSGITILPSSNGGAWIEISVLKTDQLVNIQNSLVSILNKVNGPSSGVGNNYRPHITIGHMLDGTSIRNLEFDYGSIRIKNLLTTYGIGLGEKFKEFKL